MKKSFQLFGSIFVFISCFFSFYAHGQEKTGNGRFTIQGKIKNFGDGILVGTIRTQGSNPFILDTITVKNDRFKHSGSVTEPQVVQYKAGDDRFTRFRKVLKDGDSVMMDFSEKISRTIEIAIAPGSAISIQGIASSFLDAYPSGTRENELLKDLNRKRYPVFDQLGSIDFTDKKNISRSLRTEDSLNRKIQEFEDALIKQYPSSLAAAYMVWGHFQDLSRRHPAKADSLAALLGNGKPESIYQTLIRTLQQERIKNNATLAPGDLFQGFETDQTYDGRSFSLEQTRGKYTLIDFWGSWCIPCVRELPVLKKYYEQYKDQLNIVSIAHDNYQSWKTFLDKTGYGWIQILDQETSSLCDHFQITTYPTKYLLDPEGKVVRIFVDSDKAIWGVLDKLLNKESDGSPY